jgi:hypothetical protein
MAIVWYIWILLQVLIGYNLYLPILLFIFFKEKVQEVPVAEEDDYGIIVTAYEQIDAIGNVVASLLKLHSC